MFQKAINFETFKLSYDEKIASNTVAVDIPISKKKLVERCKRSKYTNLDCLYGEIQEWFNEFLEDSLLTSSKIMNKHHLGEKNIYPDIIHLLEKNICLESKVIERSILNEITPDEILSD